MIEMKKRWTAKEFVEVWQTSKTIEEVCERTGKLRSIALNRASYFRRRGIPLKNLISQSERKNRANNVVDWLELGVYAAQLLNSKAS